MCQNILEFLCLWTGSLSICAGHLSQSTTQVRQCSCHIRDRLVVWILCLQTRFLICHMGRLHLHLLIHRLASTFAYFFRRACRQHSKCSFLYEMRERLSSWTYFLIRELSRNEQCLQEFLRMVWVASVISQRLCVKLEIVVPFPN